MDELHICSFNMHIFNHGIGSIKSVSQAFDVICLQEHWLQAGNILLFCQFYNCHKFVRSGMHDTDIHSVRRPYGGLAVLIKASIITKLTD